MSPYIVTTKRPRREEKVAAAWGPDVPRVYLDEPEILSRRAVATLDETGVVDQINAAADGGALLPASVALPDRTVIVEATTWRELASAAKVAVRTSLAPDDPPPGEQQRILDAYNARQEGT